MNQNSLANLQKWSKGTSGNPAGRKLGSKNIATIVKELLEQEIDTRFPLNDRLKQLIADNGTSYAKVIVYAMLLKAIEIYGPKMVNTRWKVVDIKLKEPYAEFLQSQNFELGRVGAINLEQLDVLLESLKSYWDYSKQKSFLDEIKSTPAKPVDNNYAVAYEL